MSPPRSVSVKAAVLLTFCSRRLGGLLRFSCCWGVGRVDSAAVDSAYLLTLALVGTAVSEPTLAVALLATAFS